MRARGLVGIRNSAAAVAVSSVAARVVARFMISWAILRLERPIASLRALSCPPFPARRPLRRASRVRARRCLIKLPASNSLRSGKWKLGALAACLRMRIWNKINRGARDPKKADADEIQMQKFM